jgi:hypothetical protein
VAATQEPREFDREAQGTDGNEVSLASHRGDLFLELVRPEAEEAEVELDRMLPTQLSADLDVP